MRSASSVTSSTANRPKTPPCFSGPPVAQTDAPAPTASHAVNCVPPTVLEPRGREVGGEGLRRPVVDRDVMPLPALLVEPEPP